ncbi:MAG: hypothetical protein ACKN82_17275 [Pirellula sp.]
MIDAPNLKTKSLSTADKKRALKMQVHPILQLGIDRDAKIDESRAEKIVAENGEATALLAYGHDLIQSYIETSVISHATARPSKNPEIAVLQVHAKQWLETETPKFRPVTRSRSGITR